MDGRKSLMLKTINVWLLFSSILLNQLMTFSVCCLWCQGSTCLISQFWFSLGFWVLLRFFVKFRLWSSSEIKHSLWSFKRILLAIDLSFTMIFSSKLICLSIFLIIFLYVVVIESFSNLLYFSFPSLHRFVVLLVNISVLISLLISCLSFWVFFKTLIVLF